MLVIGAGVAGLAAIGAATAWGRLCVPLTRPEVKEQVKSMGAFSKLILKKKVAQVTAMRK